MRPGHNRTFDNGLGAIGYTYTYRVAQKKKRAELRD